MFIGHIAVALGAKKAAPKVSLGTLIMAAQFVDLLWPIFLLLGVEHVRINPGDTAYTPLDFYDYPVSHSLLTGVGWAIVFGLVYYAIRRSARNAWILAACVISHWLLDLVVHRPDLPIVPGLKTYVGLGLWNSVPATVIVEGALFVVGIVFVLALYHPSRPCREIFVLVVHHISRSCGGRKYRRRSSAERDGSCCRRDGCLAPCGLGILD